MERLKCAVEIQMPACSYTNKNYEARLTHKERNHQLAQRAVKYRIKKNYHVTKMTLSSINKRLLL